MTTPRHDRIKKCLMVLRELSGPRSVSAADISEYTGIHLRMVYRYIHTIEEVFPVEKTHQGGPLYTYHINKEDI